MSSDKQPLVGDVLGAAPYGEALKIAVEKSAETAQQFLYDICRPAAGEVGLLLRDNVRAWRAKNLMRIVDKARELVTVTAEGVQLCAPPRIVAEIVEHSSWCDDEQLQTMWAGLLASSCTEDAKDESNLIFTDILKRLASAEARLLRHVCPWWGRERGRIAYGLSLEEISAISGLKGDTVIEYHLGHLNSLGLINNKYTVTRKDLGRSVPNVKPEMLAVHLFVRCEGWHDSPDEYFQKEGNASVTSA